MSQNEPTQQAIPNGERNLDPKDLLIAQFNYIADNVFQANEDRARVSSYYFVTAAAVVAAILGTNLQDGSIWLDLGLMLLFMVLSFIGYFTVLQLARLRIAWRDSAEAMNRVVKYYIDHSTDSQVEQDLVWFRRDKQLPTQGRVESVSFLLALSVIVADFGTFVAAFIYGEQGILAFLSDKFISAQEWILFIVNLAIVMLGFGFVRFQLFQYFEWVGKKQTDDIASGLERTLRRFKLIPSLEHLDKSHANIERQPLFKLSKKQNR
jgi:hypothetical protein